MHSTSDGEPIFEHGTTRERPLSLSPSTTPAHRRPSGEGAPLRTPTAMAAAQRGAVIQIEPRTGNVAKLLRHRLTSPEKRTVKRIQAQRTELFSAGDGVSLEEVRERVLQMLRDDRGLREGMSDASAYEKLAALLVDRSLSAHSAAELVGMFLREIGAMERPELSAPRVKAALRVLNEILYGNDLRDPIAEGVREFRLEKRDGGLQVVGLLRVGASEPAVAASCLQALQAAGLHDVDVRLVARV